jgi:hypothetical protein
MFNRDLLVASAARLIKRADSGLRMKFRYGAAPVKRRKIA